MEKAYSDALMGVEGRLCPQQTVTPPNRLETTNRDLLLALLTASRRDSRQALIDEIRRITGQRHVLLSSSGRAAIAHILSLLPHQEVVIPAYTCPAVKMAALVAGKNIICVDCSKGGLNATSQDFEPEAVEGRVLIPTHIFGLPTDIDNICALAKARGCVTIEDAAAYFPMQTKRSGLGKIADFTVFSFERSKRIPAFRGAAIVVNNDQVLDPEILASNSLTTAKDQLPVRELLFSLIYNLVSQPWTYGRFVLPRILNSYMAPSNLEKMQSPYVARQSPFFNRAFTGYQAELVLRVLKRLEDIGQHIKKLVAVYNDCFASTTIQTFVNDTCDEKALLRYPIAIPGIERGEILRRALRGGLYLETNYESIIAPKEEQRVYPNACWAAENVVLLPLYRGLPLDAAETIGLRTLKISEGARVGRVR